MSVGIEHPLINHPHIQPVSANAAAAATAITHVDNDKKPMKQQLNRRRSFINWPCAHVTPDELAEEGFYYTQSRDIVKCAFCGLELGKWQAGDVPAVDHRTWSPACPLVRRAECGNVRMSDADRSSVLADQQQQQSASSPAANYDTCGKYGIHVRVNSGPENGTPVDVRRYAVKHTSAHPHYVMRDERLRTFKDWPVSIKQRPAELADAGFFYSGKGDQTICYSCGGGLKAWEEADDPWEQHASWFPACSYLRMHKTPEYIALHNKVSNKDIAAVGNNAAAGTSQQEPAAPARPVRSLNSTQAPPTPSTQSATVTSSAPSSAASAKDPNHPGQPVNLCKICFQKEVGVVFLPCGHMVACVECGAALDKCAVCRRELEATVRAFLS